MGIFQSVPVRESEPITVNRIREACQVNTLMPPEFRRFSIELLASDLNKYGARINLRDKSGKPVPVDQICERIHTLVPDVEKVCILNSRNRDSKETNQRIKEFADKMNKVYGSSILTANPYTGQDYPAERICDQMYAVGDKIMRNLSDNTSKVKQNLMDAIQALETKKVVLDKMFEGQIASISEGQQYDELKKKIAEVRNAQNSIANVLNGRIGVLGQYNELQFNNLKVLEAAKAALAKARESKKGEDLLAALTLMSSIRQQPDVCVADNWNDIKSTVQSLIAIPEIAANKDMVAAIVSEMLKVAVACKHTDVPEFKGTPDEKKEALKGAVVAMTGMKIDDAKEVADKLVELKKEMSPEELAVLESLKFGGKKKKKGSKEKKKASKGKKKRTKSSSK